MATFRSVGRSAGSAAGRAASARPDLQAHDSAIRAPFHVVARELTELLGARLVAYIAKVTETRAVHEWGAQGRGPKDASVAPRLRLALQVALLIAQRDSHEVVQAWFQGLNPQLSDRSPARLLREGDLAEVGPEIVAAARAFMIGG
jgi:hypothetical protein